jgi:hypothetical protein
MIDRRKLTAKETVLLVLGCALFFSTVFAIVGPLASQQTRDAIAAFATDGATATGKVIGKEFKNVAVSRAPIWRLNIEFQTDKGEHIQDWPLVANTIYDRYNVGDPVRVTYVRSHPQSFYIPGGEPKAGDITTFEVGAQYARFVAGASLIGLLVVAFAGRSGGAPSKRTRAKTSAPAPKPLQQGPRSEFGSRRRA